MTCPPSSRGPARRWAASRGRACRRRCGSTATATTTAATRRATRPARWLPARATTPRPSPPAPRSGCGSGSSTRTPATGRSCRSITRSCSRPRRSCSPTNPPARTESCTRSRTRTRPSGRCRTRPPTSPPTRPCSPPPSARRPAETQIEPYARTDEATKTQLLSPSADAQGNDVIADSYQPSAALHNVENVGLEPVWPYGVIGDNTVVSGDNLTALADRTYTSRANVNANDWSFDAVDAGRLDMASQVQSDLVANVEKYQVYISGLAAWNPGSADEPYIEQAANDATALDEALATDYEGTLRFAPAWPSGWDTSGTIYIQGGGDAGRRGCHTDRRRCASGSNPSPITCRL